MEKLFNYYKKKLKISLKLRLILIFISLLLEKKSNNIKNINRILSL